MLGTPADFAAAERPEPVVLYRSLMTDPASTGSAYSAASIGNSTAWCFYSRCVTDPSSW